MRQFSLLASFALLIAALGVFVAARNAPARAAARIGPTGGWTIHIDAKKHFGDAHPNEIAHHWCKPVRGMLECQIYDSDAKDAHLVAVEAIVKPEVYKSLGASEQALWHYHKTEIPKVDAKLPDMTPAQAKKMTAGMLETYGKVYVLWDPAASKLPLGQPSVTVLK